MAVKRSIILINPSFQLKFSIFVCSVVFLISLVYPVSIFSVFEQILDKYRNIIPSDEVYDFRRSIIIIFIGTELLFLGLVFLICIFQSHKIAGPIFKLRKTLKNIRSGNPFEKIYFRKGDNFPELAEDFNETFSYIQDTHHQDFAYISEVNSFIKNLSLVVPEDKRTVLTEITHKLKEIQDRFKQ